MSFLRNSNLDLTISRIETDRCILIPFSIDGRVDIRELADEFCRANKDLYVSPFLPTYEQELEFVRASDEKIASGEEFENFILDKRNNALIGAAGLRLLKSGEVNIGIWIRESEQGKLYASEVYGALILWAKENLAHDYLVHSLNPENTGSRKLAEKFGGVYQTEKTESGNDIYHILLN